MMQCPLPQRLNDGADGYGTDGVEVDPGRAGADDGLALGDLSAVRLDRELTRVALKSALNGRRRRLEKNLGGKLFLIKTSSSDRG